MNCKVFYACWQMQCCGDPFKPGDTVKWLVRKDFELINSDDVELNDLDYVYDAHDHTVNSILTGVVTRIWGLYEKYEQSEDNPILMYPVHGELIELDSVDGEEESIGELEISGYVVELENCYISDMPKKITIK